MNARNWLLPEASEEGPLRAFWTAYRPAVEEMRTELTEVVRRHPTLAFLAEVPRDETEEARVDALQREAIEHGKWEPYIEHLHAQGRQYAQAGLRVEHWYELLRLMRVTILKRLAAQHANDAAGLATVVSGMDRFMDISMGAIASAYVTEKERIIADQAAAIRELSTPILRLRDRFLVVPVVGVVDTHRARELTESLLHAVRRYRARSVVVDITGVPIVDSKVANHLVQTVEAVRLMGAHVVLSGISPDIARTLVAIGANMSSVVTVGEFDLAVEMAEKLVHETPRETALALADEGA